MKALIYGWGYLGSALGRSLLADGWTVAGTSRDVGRRAAIASEGAIPIDPSDHGALANSARGADGVLVTAAPTPKGCPAFLALAATLTDHPPRWLGYVSTTGVYGDRGGKWVSEDSQLNAPTADGARRVAVEREWVEHGRRAGFPVAIFRLPAIYGPGRSPFERLRDGSARVVRKPGQVFNRIHRDDAVAAMRASLARPRPAGRVYNVADDDPAGADAYVEHAARLLNVPRPEEVDWTDSSVSEGMRRFYNDNKRVSNARAKAELGWRPRYPSWREGLAAVLEAESF